MWQILDWGYPCHPPHDSQYNIKYALWPAVEPFSRPASVTEKYLLVKPSFPVALDMMLARDMNRFPNLPVYRVVPSTLIVHMVLGGASMNQEVIPLAAQRA